MILPIEIINEILCFAVDRNNYSDLLILNKDISKYFRLYYKKIIQNGYPGSYVILPIKILDIQYTYHKQIPEDYSIEFKIIDEVNYDINKYIFIKKKSYIDLFDNNDLYQSLSCAYDSLKQNINFPGYPDWMPEEYPELENSTDEEMNIKRLEIIDKYQKKYGYIKFYIYHDHTIFGNITSGNKKFTIRLYYIDLSNLVKVANIVYNKMTKLDCIGDHTCFEGIRYKGHYTINNISYPIYKAIYGS